MAVPAAFDRPSGSPVATTTASGTARTSCGSAQLTAVSPTSGWQNGMVVSGAGTPANTRIVSGAGSATLTLSRTTRASGAGVAITGTDGVVAAPRIIWSVRL